MVKLSFLSSVTLYHAFDIKSFWKKEMGLVRTDKSKVSMPITANLWCMYVHFVHGMYISHNISRHVHCTYVPMYLRPFKVWLSGCASILANNFDHWSILMINYYSYLLQLVFLMLLDYSNFLKHLRRGHVSYFFVTVIMISAMFIF